MRPRILPWGTPAWGSLVNEHCPLRPKILKTDGSNQRHCNNQTSRTGCGKLLRLAKCADRCFVTESVCLHQGQNIRLKTRFKFWMTVTVIFKARFLNKASSRTKVCSNSAGGRISRKFCSSKKSLLNSQILYAHTVISEMAN